MEYYDGGEWSITMIGMSLAIVGMEYDDDWNGV